MKTTEHEVTVTFDSKASLRKVTFDPETNLGVPTERGLVSFKLEVKEGSETALFPSNPIQWVDSDTRKPMAPPPEAMVARGVDGVSTVVLILAEPGVVKSFSFYVIVQTADGKFFGSDPTIVTMRPPGGGEGR